MKRWTAFLAVPLFLFSNTLTAYATPTVYQENVYVGNQWTGPGDYDDSVPEEPGGNPLGMIVADSTGDSGDHFTYFELKGNLPSTATVTVEFYAQSGSSTDVSTAQYLGSHTYTSADLNQMISVPYTNAWGMSMHIYDNGSTGGDVYLYETWSTDTNVSTTGRMIWATPPWVTSSGGSSGGSMTCPPPDPPPDWATVAQTFLAQMPPIPYESANQLTVGNPPLPSAPVLPDPPTMNTPDMGSTATDLANPDVGNVPQAPAETGSTPQDWVGDSQNAINVPTTGSSAFSIPDPNNLPHQPEGTILVPGQVPDTGYKPADPSLKYANPTTGQTPPTPQQGPQPNNQGTQLIGTIPTYSGSAATSSGPVPGSYQPPSTGVSPSPSPQGNTSTPTYGEGGTADHNTPLYNFPTN